MGDEFAHLCIGTLSSAWEHVGVHDQASSLAVFEVLDSVVIYCSIAAVPP
jgi:hypothetical protein